MKSLIALIWSWISFLISSPGPVFCPALVVTSTIAAMIAARIAITRISPITLRTRLPADRFAAAGAGVGGGRGPRAGGGGGGGGGGGRRRGGRGGGGAGRGGPEPRPLPPRASRLG